MLSIQRRPRLKTWGPVRRDDRSDVTLGHNAEEGGGLSASLARFRGILGAVGRIINPWAVLAQDDAGHQSIKAEGAGDKMH